MPTLGSSLWYTLITTVVLGVGIGVLAQPQLVVRFMSVKSDRSLNLAILVGGPFIMLMTGVAFTVGALTNVYFYREAGQTALEAAGGNVDAIIPLYINASMPDVFIIIFMLALLSAAMSTLSSLFHTMGAALGHDLLLGRTREGAAQKTAQASTAVMIVASVALAYVMPGNIIARATAMFMGLCASALLPAFVMALYDKAPSALAAKTSIVTGAAVWFAWTAFVHVKESAALGISSFLFGKDTLLSMPWPVVDPLVIALPLSALALVAMKLWETRSALPMVEEGAESL
jgi:SSS family solute:Na+ symporter